MNKFMTKNPNAEPTDQTKRRRQMAMLEASITSQECKIMEQRLLLENMTDKLIARRAELRCQQILLDIAEHPGRRRNH